MSGVHMLQLSKFVLSKDGQWIWTAIFRGSSKSCLETKWSSRTRFFFPTVPFEAALLS